MQRKESASERRSFERRSSYRVSPSPSDPIRGTLELAGVEVSATVRNLSIEGIALVAHGKLRPPTALGTNVELALHLPHGLGRFHLHAMLVRLERSPQHTCYALRFTLDRTAESVLQQQRVHTYVMRRQIETVGVMCRRERREPAARPH